MKKSKAQQMAHLWNEVETTAATATIAEVNPHPCKSLGYEVVVHPDRRTNDGDTFYHIGRLADICRAFGVGCYVTIEDGNIVAFIH